MTAMHSKGGCVNSNNSFPCDDGSLCTLSDKCVGGSCVPGPVFSCDDGNPCTDDSCDKISGCTHAINAEGCSDNNVCTQIDVCVGGKCKPGATLTCDDGNSCTSDTCSASLGCAHNNNSAPCSDGSVCTSSDQCADGACIAGSKMLCNDGNPCTTDSCDAVIGCVFSNNSNICDDGNGCTGGDICSNGQCKGALGCSVNGQCSPGAQSTVCACKPGYGRWRYRQHYRTA